MNRPAILLFGIILVSLNAIGQVGKETEFIEKINLFTDRSLYIAGEQIHFSAIISPNAEEQSNQSKVLYVECISPDGKSIVRNKFSISDHVAEGCLEIPTEIITGVYYLRAYTRYLRNQGPAAYAYIMMKIVNPFREDVLDGNDIPALKNDPVSRENVLNITTDKNNYTYREKVKATLSGLVPSQLNTIQTPRMGLTVAVVPEASAIESMYPLPIEDISLPSSLFYPETRGVSITGKVNDIVTGEGIAGAKVNLSIIGQGRDFMAAITDSSGRYYISLPYYTGFRDIFLFAEKDSVLKPQILVDNDFCSIPVHLSSPEFVLSADECIAVLAMARNSSISRAFEEDTIPCSSVAQVENKPFYGVPTDVIYFDEYVPLPTIEEYFDELGTAVKVRKHNGLNYFKVIGTQPELNYYNPLVLVDWVAVNNIEKILAASPSTIERIEIINVPYVKGDVTYGGIISIISKRGDFSGIDLPTSGVFLNYQGLSDNCSCSIIEMDTLHLPDARNLLYWNPHLELDPGNDATITFKTPDTPGRYSIVVSGVDAAGKKWRQSRTFEVR